MIGELVPFFVGGLIGVGVGVGVVLSKDRIYAISGARQRSDFGHLGGYVASQTSPATYAWVGAAIICIGCLSFGLALITLIWRILG